MAARASSKGEECKKKSETRLCLALVTKPGLAEVKGFFERSSMGPLTCAICLAQCCLFLCFLLFWICSMPKALCKIYSYLKILTLKSSQSMTAKKLLHLCPSLLAGSGFRGRI